MCAYRYERTRDASGLRPVKGGGENMADRPSRAARDIRRKNMMASGATVKAAPQRPKKSETLALSASSCWRVLIPAAGIEHPARRESGGVPGDFEGKSAPASAPASDEVRRARKL